MALILKLMLKNVVCELENMFRMLFAHWTDEQVKTAFSLCPTPLEGLSQ